MMDCFANTTTDSITPSCMRRDASSSSCFWEEAIYDCFQDFSGHSLGTSNHSQRDFGGNAEEGEQGASTTTEPQNCSLLDQLQDEHDDCLGGGVATAEEQQQVEREGYGAHAALHFEDVVEAGPPARPQDFPTPYVHEGERKTVRAVDHRTLQVRDVKNVLMMATTATTTTTTTQLPQRAYLMKKKTSKSCYGNTYLSVVLKRRTNKDCYDHVDWESTDEFVAITVSPWNPTIRQQQHRRSRSGATLNPIHAIAAMQHLGSYHPHILGCLDVLQDDDYLYTITKFHGGMDLQTKIVLGREQGAYVPNEVEARKIFSQLLQGIFHLQKKGVCHSNLSLENILVDNNNENLMIIDLGRSMRIPYNDPSNFGCVTGETEGTTRRLVQLDPLDFTTHPAESLMYLAPEIVENEHAFDGFAADLWAASVCLFVLLVGMAPFKSSHYWDAAYAEISSGNLKGLLQSLNIQLSEEATSLLQNLFWRDPADRLTLAKILNHPWVKGERFSTTNRQLSKNYSSGHLSSVETASTTSSFSTDKAKSSAGSKKSVRRTMGIFGSGSSVASSNTSGSGSLSRTLTNFLTPNKTKKRTSSIGGLSSAASSATAGSPTSPRDSVPDDEMGFNVKVLSIPKL